MLKMEILARALIEGGKVHAQVLHRSQLRSTPFDRNIIARLRPAAAAW